MRRIASASLFLALAACGPAPAPEGAHENTASVEPEPLDPGAPAAEQAALASCGPVTTAGYCGVTFGLSPADAAKKFPVPLDGYDGADPVIQADPNHCFEMFAAEPVQGISFMIEQNRVGRIDFLTEAGKTADGFGVGTPADDIRGKFGAVAVGTPNKYEAEVTDLTVTQGATKFVFEIQDGKVRGWRVGVAPTVDYTEHCG
jgi:hypothetical protein